MVHSSTAPVRGAVAKVLLGACLVALTGAAGCGANETLPTNVVFIVVDTLRADRLGCYGYTRATSPAIDALAADGTQFARAYASAPWTVPSVASILTGLYPSGHQVSTFRRGLPEGALTLAGVLSDSGYATGAVVSHKLIDSSRSFDRGFGEFHEAEALGHEHVSTPGVTRTARELLARFAADPRPFFLFVHYFDPHYLFQPHPEYGFASRRIEHLESEDIWELRDRLGTMSREEIRHLEDLYDEEIRFTDAGVRELLGDLKALGVDDRTIVLFTADHGEEFVERGWLGHTITLHEEVMRVPLVVRSPGDPSGVVHTPVSLTAIPPTILDLMGLAAPLEYPCASAAPFVRGETVEAEAIFMEVSVKAKRKRTRKRALVEGDLKLIRDDMAHTNELYDLAADPGETTNLVPERVELADLMHARLDSMNRVAATDPLPTSETELGAPALESLRSLGYVETGAGDVDSSGAD